MSRYPDSICGPKLVPGPYYSGSVIVCWGMRRHPGPHTIFHPGVNHLFVAKIDRYGHAIPSELSLEELKPSIEAYMEYADSV